MKRKPYATETVTATATDGSSVKLVVPTDLPSKDKADLYDTLFFDERYVTFLDDHRKGRVKAVVPESLRQDMADAMDYWGAIVDRTEDMGNGMWLVYSDGYWAHGF